MNYIKIFIEFIVGTIKSQSICRIYQLNNFKKIFFKGKALEFGEDELKRSFLQFSNLKKKIFFLVITLTQKKIIILELT